MADFSGIEAVTSTVRQILLQRTTEPPTVTAAPPDVDVPDTDPPLLNLFLYRVSENGALKNQQLPARAGPASLGPAPLCLDLHYLLTATGASATDDRGAHRVLGDAMLALHDHPIVAKDDPLLDPALGNEVELLKITLEILDTEDLSKIWTATTAPYRLAVGYRVTVLQLESARPPRVARPVLEAPEAGPRVHAFPLDRPAIDTVAVIRRRPDGTEGPEQRTAYARLGERLVIRGRGLRPGTRVLLGDVDATSGVQGESTGERLVVEVPDEPALQPGMHGVHVVRDVPVGEPPDERLLPAARSAVAPFVLVPTLSEVDPTGGPDGTTVAVRGERLAVEGTASWVLVGGRVLIPAPGATPGELEITVTGVAAGTHPVSVRVGGAESIDPVTFEVTP